MGMQQVLLWTLAASMCVLRVSGLEFDAAEEGGGGSSFLMHDSKLVVKTSAGHMSVVRGLGRLQMQTSMHIGFISMDPNSLFVPQYMDSNLILFVHQGQAKVGSICQDELVERGLSEGDVFRIPAGSAFYILNKHSETLNIVCSIDMSDSLGGGPFQAFSIGGGTFPKSVLAGFSHNALTSAFNVSMEQLGKIMTRQDKGPIISLSDPATVLFEMKEAERIKLLKKAIQVDDQDEEFNDRSWSWRKLLSSVFGQAEEPKHSGHVINLYDRKPDFKNDYGWSVSIDQKHYSPLKHSGIGIYYVSLSAGSMLAPHVNPTATEYGIVLRGTGSIQIVFPNGTSALDAKVGRYMESEVLGWWNHHAEDKKRISLRKKMGLGGWCWITKQGEEEN
uniref:Cupin type-1 domain-containing protein n=1 Tax=Kalanchoe fedtschenkoi TaxID=63787 RepID=A0A7N0ZT31_KALFE